MLHHVVPVPVDAGKDYYFAFGGCHRWAAVKQLGLPTIRARLIKLSPSAINTYLGASSPFRTNKQLAAPAAMGSAALAAPLAAGVATAAAGTRETVASVATDSTGS